jgi:hypothetical protein
LPVRPVSLESARLRKDVEVVAMPFDDGSFFKGESIYRHAYTIDPSEADRAWDVLKTNEWALEFANLPRILHAALLKTIRERGVLALGK